MRKFVGGFILAGACSGLLAIPALGQSFDRDRNTSVMERPRPEYQAEGRRVGGFTALPAVTTGVEVNDNIFATSTNESDDTILKGAAELALRSNWSRHMLNFFGLVAHDEYSDFGDESHTDYTLQTDGRIDASRAVALGGTAMYQSLVEPRTSTSAPGASDRPIEYSLTDLDAYSTYERGRVRLGARGGYARYNYMDATSVFGNVIDQDFRDRDIWTATLRSDFAISPDTALFLEGAYNDRSYDLQPPAVATSRNSNGYEILAGANFDLTNLIRGEVGVGYFKQSYDAAALPSIDSFSARADVEWFVTQLTTLNFGVARTVEEGTVAGSSGYLSTQLSAGVDHELLRNVILSADLAYYEDNYEGIDRVDDRWMGSLGATYYVNRNIGVTGSYTHTVQDTSGTAGGGSEYELNIFGVSVRFQF